MASRPITSWQIDGETVTDFIFLSSKITVDSDCSHEIKRHLLLGRKAMTNLDSILSCKKRVASPGLIHDTGCLGLVHWDDPEGWYGEGRGRRVQDGEHIFMVFLDVFFRI